MKKKLLWIVGILALLALLATLIGPRIILAAARQPEPESGFAYSESFYESYEEIRLHLRQRILLSTLLSYLGCELLF